MAKIFISYNRESEPIARTLADEIEELGHTVWFDHELSGGQAWWDQILATIRDCSVFVFVLSPAGLNSTACKREYTYAAELGKPVLPVLVSDSVSINLLPPALSKIEYVDYRKQERKTALRLSRALSTVPPPGPLPDPLPKPPDAPISYLGSLTEQVDAPSNLNYQEQAALLADLRRSLRDSESSGDARTLLQKLRKRRDLLATIAEDIDEVLGSVDNRDTIPVPVVPPPVDREISRISDKQPSDSLQLRPDDNDSIPNDSISPENPALEVRDNELTGKGRLKGAGIGAAAGFVCSVPFFFVAPTMGMEYLGSSRIRIFLSIVLLLSGAIAGAISGTKPKRVFAAAAGMSVTVLYLFYHQLAYGYVPNTDIILLAPILGAVVGTFITRIKA